MKYNHIGIPVRGRFEAEFDLPHLEMTVCGRANNAYAIQWMRYWPGVPYPELVRTMPHVAFEMEDLSAEIERQNVLIEPNSPSPGVMVALIELNGAPVELLQSGGKV